MNKIYFSILTLVLSTSIACTHQSNNSTANDDSKAQSNDTNSLDSTAEGIETKESILRSLIGERQLQSIESNSGANSMSDYYREEGIWIARGSSIVNTMREAYNIQLSVNDYRRLESAKIVITEDLELYYFCDNERYFFTPFDQNGMTYKLKRESEDFIGTIPENLSSSTTIEGGYLYLYTEDELPLELVDPIDIAQIGPDAVLIAINIEQKSIEMSLFYADCCDNSVYFFQ